MENVIIVVPIHYEQQRTDKLDDNNGLLYGIYYYDVHKDDLDTDNMFNSEIVGVEWFETERERDSMLQRERELLT